MAEKVERRDQAMAGGETGSEAGICRRLISGFFCESQEIALTIQRTILSFLLRVCIVPGYPCHA